MKTLYRVRVYRGDPGREHLIEDRSYACGEPHFAAREVLFGARHKLPRGWKSLTVTVDRP